MFDYDWGLQDDFMGSALLDMTTLELSRVCELSVPLEDATKSSGSSSDSKSMHIINTFELKYIYCNELNI